VDTNNRQVSDFINTSWGYGRIGIEGETQILIPGNITVDFGLLQMLVNWDSLPDSQTRADMDFKARPDVSHILRVSGKRRRTEFWRKVFGSYSRSVMVLDLIELLNECLKSGDGGSLRNVHHSFCARAQPSIAAVSSGWSTRRRTPLSNSEV
jgi:hypothetical protein